MQERRGLEAFASSAAGDGVASMLDEMLREAYGRAGRYGVVVGRVSRYSEVRVEEGARVEFEIDPLVYYSRRDAPFHRIGDYLAILDPKTGRLILARVTSIVRRDELASLGVEPPVSAVQPRPDAAGLVTRTTVYGELLVEAEPSDGGEWRVEPAVTSVEPQSPLVDPEPWVLERLLDLPREGVPLGSLATPGGLVKGGGVVVRLPLHVFFQHVLVVGTTGSGKTTLLKNMVAAMHSLLPPPARPVVVVADMNQDFIQLPLKPPRPPEGSPEALVREAAYGGVRPPRALHVVVPFTVDDYREAYEAGGGEGVEGVVERLARGYVEESIAPLAGVEAGTLSYRVVSAGGYHYVDVDGLGFKLRVYPYTVSTRWLGGDSLLGLMPGLTMHAMDLLRRLRARVARSLGDPGPLQALHAALQAWLELVAGGRRREEPSERELHEYAVEACVSGVVSLDPGLEDLYYNRPLKPPLGSGEARSLSDYVSAYLDALWSVRPHKGTLEALYRRVSSLLDSGIVDVTIDLGVEEGLWQPAEPPWERVALDAHAEGAPVVLDLKWPGERALSSVEAPRLAAYRMLAGLIDWKHRAWAERRATPNILVFIDEAHQFFPQEKGGVEEREASRQVAAMIAKIARLGRARGVGLVFSTHSPRDLHDIVVQLSNTKIILRSEKTVAEQLAVPPGVREHIPRLPDRRLVILSHAYKEGYIIAHTTTPLTGHYDIPSTLAKR